MNWEELRQALMNVGLPDPWATVYARSQGRCTYCDHDLLAHRPGYGSAERDHLLPIVGDGPDYINLVLACRACNLVKGTHCVLMEGEDPWERLANDRLGLITRARDYVEQQYANQYNAVWTAVKQEIVDAVRAWGNIAHD